MQVVADLHSHSKYSRAVSPQMTLPVISEWCVRKGIDVVGTGDFTHPLWFKELQAQLEEVEFGLYALRSTGPVARSSRPTSSSANGGLAGGRRDALRSHHTSPLFLLSTEVAAIYSQGGKGRRIHLLIFAPDFAAVREINKEFAKRGMNLFSDGRPILGMSARDILQLVLEADERCLVIPAHAWTPWFSLYGSFSGFDSIEECFGDLAPYIYGIETGLSSDPAMNWRIADLKTRSILSFSDAHSPQKLGRELTVFQIKNKRSLAFQAEKLKMKNDNPKLKITYEDITNAIKDNPAGDWEIGHTIEFYPEEGKYHFTGHRNCNVRHSPLDTKEKGTVCPVCKRSLTVGVMHRVEELARQTKNEELITKNDEYGVKWLESADGRPKYVMSVPLLEILAESLGTLVSSQKVINEYKKLTDEYKNEVAVLLRIKGEDIERISGQKVREGIEKVRRGDIVIDPGFDGVFGRVRIWNEEAKSEKLKAQSEEANQVDNKQMGLF